MLARLLRGSTSPLTELHLLWKFPEPPLLDAPSAAELGGALSANRTLTTLNLHNLHLWSDDPAAATCATLLRALTGHPTLLTLALARNYVSIDQDAVRATAAAALAALVAANAPALTPLDVSESTLRDDGLRPLLAALPANEHLRVLNVDANTCSAAFAREELLPAVRANASLRILSAWDLEHYNSLEATSEGEDEDPEWPQSDAHKFCICATAPRACGAPGCARAWRSRR